VTKGRRKAPTAAERNAKEYRAHVAEVLPNLDMSQWAAFLPFDGKDPDPIAPSQRLTEYAFGCQSKDDDGPLPIIFASAEDRAVMDLSTESSACIKSLIQMVDQLNRVNWGYPDGYTAIQLPDHCDRVLKNRRPFIVLRGCGGWDGSAVPATTNTATERLVFASPACDATGIVVGSATCNMVEFVLTYDHETSKVGPPPYGRAALRDRVHRARYADLHLLAKFQAPPSLDVLFARCDTAGAPVLAVSPPPLAQPALPLFHSKPHPYAISTLDDVVHNITIIDFIETVMDDLGATGLMALVVSDPRSLKPVVPELTLSKVIGDGAAAGVKDWLAKLLSKP